MFVNSSTKLTNWRTWRSSSDWLIAMKLEIGPNLHSIRPDTYLKERNECQNVYWQNSSLNLPDVQPIITILGLKKNPWRAYFVTFGALVNFNFVENKYFVLNINVQAVSLYTMSLNGVWRENISFCVCFCSLALLAKGEKCLCRGVLSVFCASVNNCLWTRYSL